MVEVRWDREKRKGEGRRRRRTGRKETPGPFDSTAPPTDQSGKDVLVFLWARHLRVPLSRKSKSYKAMQPECFKISPLSTFSSANVVDSSF